MKFYVMEFDEDDRKMVALDEEPDARTAMANRRSKINAHPDRTIVVFSARSVEVLRRNHPRYFREVRDDASLSDAAAALEHSRVSWQQEGPRMDKLQAQANSWLAHA